MRAEVLAWTTTVVCALAFAACPGEPRKRFGQSCGADDECASGLCVAGAGQPGGICTKSCRRNDQCPRGYSCSGATTKGVVICVRGGAAPFLPAN